MPDFISTLLSSVGALTLLYVVVGFALDVQSFDQTKGGYLEPYTGWTGTPVDWTSLDQTKEGVVKRGHVVDVFVNMTTGMITFGVAGLRYDWRVLSDRALAVHRPREAAVALGFQPQF